MYIIIIYAKGGATRYFFSFDLARVLGGKGFVGQEKAEYPVYSTEEGGCLCISLPLAVLWRVK